MDSEEDKAWLIARLSHVLSDEIEYFLERVSIMWDGGNGMPPQQARAASLILLVDRMRL